MDMLNYFRKGLDSGWVCRSAVRLTVDRGRVVRFRPGQVIYIGDYRYEGMDMVLALDRRAGPGPVLAVERPQSISAALAP
jgi:hypothetical protein